MLYTCPCQTFNSQNNNFRKIVKKLLNLYIRSLFKANLLKKVLFIFLEPGGLFDEFEIIKSIFSLDYTISEVTIILIEPEQNDEIIRAQKIFCKKIKEISSYIECIIFSNVRQLEKFLKKDQCYDFIQLISIDPQSFLYIPRLSFGERVDDLLLLMKSRSTFGMQLFLYEVKNYYYSVWLDYRSWNTVMHKDKIMFTRCLGNTRQFESFYIS